MSYSVTFYENDKELDLNKISGQEHQSLQDYLLRFADSDMIKCPHTIDDEEQSYAVIIESNIEKIDKMIDKKMIINPSQYGVNPWGKVEMYLQKYDLKRNKNEADKKIRKCSNCKCTGHNIKSCPLLMEVTKDEESVAKKIDEVEKPAPKKAASSKKSTKTSTKKADPVEKVDEESSDKEEDKEKPAPKKAVAKKSTKASEKKTEI